MELIRVELPSHLPFAPALFASAFGVLSASYYLPLALAEGRRGAAARNKCCFLARDAGSLMKTFLDWSA
jgi:hypothetical protein